MGWSWATPCAGAGIYSAASRAACLFSEHRSLNQQRAAGERRTVSFNILRNEVTSEQRPSERQHTHTHTHTHTGWSPWQHCRCNITARCRCNDRFQTAGVSYGGKWGAFHSCYDVTIKRPTASDFPS